MGERKVISKYYPPDFDPSKVAKIKVKRPTFTKVTTMLPMSIRCNTCGEYIGRGTKFNAKKETVQNEDYLGIKIYRFFLRCKKCAAELTIKTDPKNSEYVCESGATRNYEPWKETDEEKSNRMTKEQEEEQDAMIALENRTLESKREMEMLDALEEIKSLNSRNSEIDTEQLLEYNLQKQELEEKLQDEEDDLLVKSIFNNKNKLELNQINDNNSINNNIDSNKIKRIENDDDDGDKFNSLFSNNNKNNKNIINNNNNNNNNINTTSISNTIETTPTTNQKTSILGNKVKVVINKQEEPIPKNNNNSEPNSFSSFMSAYSDDEED
ncbi:hypothetical protein DDB_G0279481 [Dictyostelium discoideum AX4]|uniref:Splicing factor YJU2 n=1 Tax=Dictyostelium discoideum TaxID=44689 RepID=YJU2_DICDI|nr:hypothetical protein DDB_G0279481 [Dictyostelium discoideum AX4]Q54WR5.1 RecName: Full=Splicing factor YJU2; AltName: Full=Coiled-coil domain-containing protein 94 homolog [Dictyostelium discoideum]EAL67679.1 hypothetical protein DDB_G0279481 [Dictyostelium discoideum AX4]|eukprot:XP_641652.1 hypothetical protein DDB_G0279481 [Dictyostelium discoideum AX4]